MNKSTKNLREYIASRPIVSQEISLFGEHNYIEIDVNIVNTLLNHTDNSVFKQEIAEKIVIDTNKLSHSVNGILNETYKARIALAKELLEGK